MLSTDHFQAGDLVFSRDDLFNDDGGIPDAAPGELLVPAGTRGMVVNAGHVEASPEIKIYLVRFEGADKELGPPVGCLVDELTQES
jgi:nitrogen fixation protein NifZ